MEYPTRRRVPGKDATVMSKPPTIQDIARELRVHKSTVSLALSGKGNVSAATRQRVLAFARELGYEPDPLAQRLARGFHNALVCLFSGGLDVGLTTEKVLRVQKALSSRGLEVPIYTCAADPGEAQLAQLRQICRQRPRAIICAAHQVDPNVFEELAGYQRAGGTVVCYDSPVPLECDQVIFDREDNAYKAAHLLLAAGHRKIGIGMTRLSGPVAGTEADPLVPRLRGFTRALAEFGLKPRDEWIFNNPTYERGGAEMARQFLQLKERPTGVCIVNDYVALAFMVEVIRVGLEVPKDVSIVSHDNQPIAAYCPVPLTSVTHPVEEIVDAVVRMLLDRVNGEIPADMAPRRTIITGDVVSRESVAAPCGALSAA